MSKLQNIAEGNCGFAPKLQCGSTTVVLGNKSYKTTTKPLKTPENTRKENKTPIIQAYLRVRLTSVSRWVMVSISPFRGFDTPISPFLALEVPISPFNFILNICRLICYNKNNEGKRILYCLILHKLNLKEASCYKIIGTIKMKLGGETNDEEKR